MDYIGVSLRPDGPIVLAIVDSDVAVVEGDPGFLRAADELAMTSQAGATIENALDTVVVPTAESVLDHLKHLSPDEVVLEFGLQISGKAGLVFASAQAQAHFTVKVTWHRTTQ